MEPADPSNPHTTVFAADIAQAPSAEPTPDPADTLSPSVRRLARQFALDVTQIQGTGPEGRIRVGDVMAMLGGRASPVPEEAPARETPAAPCAPALRAVDEPPATSLFECDMQAVLAHRKRLLEEQREVMLTSYHVAACLAALGAVPEICGDGEPTSIGVAVPDKHGNTLMPVITGTAGSSVIDIDEALKAALNELRRGKSAERPGEASFVLYHHGLTGSVLATPTPVADGHAASIGIGKIRRQVAVQEIGGQATTRLLPLCYVSVSFRPQRLGLHRANRFLAHLVARLERWPQDGPADADAPRRAD